VVIHVVALLVSVVLAGGVAFRVARTAAAATRPFVWLCGGVALWCATGAAHALAPGIDGKLWWAKLQYLAVAGVPPLWLLFTAEYAGVHRIALQPSTAVPITRRLLWVLPLLTVALAWTNEAHHMIWSSVGLADSGRAVYSYGPWFWLSALYNYALVLVGTVLVLRAARRAPAPLRGQFGAVLAAAMVPWAGNVLFLAGVLPPGIDATPIAFAASSLLLAWGLYRSYLFDLVPVARDLVIDSLSDAMVVIDSSRRILDMNAAAREVARRKGTLPESSSWIGRNLAALFPMLRDLPLETTTLDLASQVLRSGDAPACFDVHVLPVQWRGQPSRAWVVLLRDVTEERRAAAEREILERRVQEQDRREGLSILAAGVAHEFNNLLTGIVGNADLLAMQVPASSHMGTNVGAILVGAQRATDLVSKMLAYAGEGHASIERVDLDALAKDTIADLRESVPSQCEIVYEGAAAIIHADEGQVRQVAADLIANAVDAVADGGRVTIRTGAETLTRSQLTQMRFGRDAQPGEYAFLDVRDDGVGMDDVTMRRLFKPFFTTKPVGHGLGLAAVQGVVLGHRGALTVVSQPGEGSRFCVWFPLAQVARGATTTSIMRFDRSIRDGGDPRDAGSVEQRLKESA
jgi:signal transduction histidine kinase